MPAHQVRYHREHLVIRRRRLIGILLGVMGTLLLPSSSFSQSFSDETLVADFPPRKFDASRYKAIWTRNPFVAEVVAQERSTVVDEWAKGLILRAVTRIQGKYVVHVENTALAKEKDPLRARARYQRLVEDAGPSTSGDLRIVNVKAHRDPNQVEVTVALGDGPGAKEAVVKYDPKALAAASRKTATSQRAALQLPKPGTTPTRRVVTPKTTARPTPTIPRTGEAPPVVAAVDRRTQEAAAEGMEATVAAEFKVDEVDVAAQEAAVAARAQRLSAASFSHPAPAVKAGLF